MSVMMEPLTEERYVGPTTLTEALAAATPGPDGIRVAVSSPEGARVAVQFPDGRIIVRTLEKISGRAGSRMDTGTWYAEVPEWLEGSQWRPG